MIQRKVHTGLVRGLQLAAEHSNVYLNEANFLSVATEALPAAHKAILPYQSMRVPTHTTARREQETTITIGKACQQN